MLAIVAACSDASTDPVEAPTPTSVEDSPSSLSLASLGETVHLTATVLDRNGQVMVDATVVWVSAHPSVAAVDQRGLVTAVGNGATNLTATAGTGTASVAVTVEQIANSIVLSALPGASAVIWIESPTSVRVAQ